MNAATAAPFTLRSAAGIDAAPPPLADSVLIVIDAQLEYGVGGGLELPGVTAAVHQIVELVAAARRLGTPVIHIAHQGPAGGLFDPGSGGEILPAVKPAESEHVIHKTLPNAFAGTALRDELRDHGDPPLVLAGFMTHMCVGSTARAALDLGLRTTVVSDATATRALPPAAGRSPVSADDLHRASLAALADRFSTVVPSATLITTTPKAETP